MFQLLSIVYGFCFDNENICVDAYIYMDRAYFTLIVPNTTDSYSGFGIGTSMVMSDIVTFEITGQESVLRPRKAPGYSRPSILSNMIDLQDIKYSTNGNKQVVEFSRSLIGKNGFEREIIEGNNNIVWAKGSIDSGLIMQHSSSSRARTTLMINKNTTTTAEPVPMSTKATVVSTIVNTEPSTKPMVSTQGKAQITVMTNSDSVPSSTSVLSTSTMTLNVNCIDDMQRICFSAFANGTKMQFSVEIPNTPNTWVGIGLGSGMASADIITIENKDTELFLNARKASGYSLPTKVSNVGLSLISLSVVNNRVVAKFTLPLEATGSFQRFIDPVKNDMIYAYGVISNREIQLHQAKGSKMAVPFGYSASVPTSDVTIAPQDNSGSLPSTLVMLVALMTL